MESLIIVKFVLANASNFFTESLDFYKEILKQKLMSVSIILISFPYNLRVVILNKNIGRQ